jgi:AraC-like DNA-binding protein
VSVVFRTVDTPAASRVDAWEQRIGDALLPLRGRHDAGDFRAALTAGRIGAVRVTEATTPAGECFRTPQMIDASNESLYQVDVMVRGEVVVAQGGRQARLSAGDLALVDPARPVTYTSTATTHVSVVFPRALVPLRPKDLTHVTGVRVPGDQGTGALASSLARQLPRHLDDCGSAEAVRLGGAVVDLLSLALSAQLDGERSLPPQAYQRALVRQVYAFIDEHLGVPTLSLADIAAVHHVSLRQLHKLFHAERVTVAGWVRQRRLERCRLDLLDPGQRARPVSAIAARWGLPNAAHFSRLFKRAYGVTPAQYRALGGSAQRAEEPAQILDEQVGNLERGEVAAALEVRPVHDGVDPVGEVSHRQ